jgi:hypothetical protein
MPFPLTCPSCGKGFQLADEVFEKKVSGKLVSIKCRQCQAGIRIDATNPSAVKVLGAVTADGTKSVPPPGHDQLKKAEPAPKKGEPSKTPDPARAPAPLRPKQPTLIGMELHGSQPPPPGTVALQDLPGWSDLPAPPEIPPAPVAAAPPAAVPAVAPEPKAPPAPALKDPPKAAAPAAKLEPKVEAKVPPKTEPKPAIKAQVQPAAPAAKEEAPPAQAVPPVPKGEALKTAALRGGPTAARSLSDIKPAPQKASTLGVKPAATATPVATPKAAPVAAKTPAVVAKAAPTVAATPATPATKTVTPETPKPAAVSAKASLEDEPRWAVDSQSGDDRELSDAEMFAEIAAGRILADTLVWHEGMDEWLEVEKIPNLARHLPKPPEPQRLKSPELPGPPRARQASAPILGMTPDAPDLSTPRAAPVGKTLTLPKAAPPPPPAAPAPPRFPSPPLALPATRVAPASPAPSPFDDAKPAAAPSPAATLPLAPPPPPPPAPPPAAPSPPMAPATPVFSAPGLIPPPPAPARPEARVTPAPAEFVQTPAFVQAPAPPSAFGSAAANAMGARATPFAAPSPAGDTVFPPTRSKLPLIVGAVLLIGGGVAAAVVLGGKPAPPPLPTVIPTQPSPAATPAETAAPAATQESPAEAPTTAPAPVPGGPAPASGDFASLFAKGVTGANVPKSTDRFDASLARKAVTALLPAVAACKVAGSPAGTASLSVTFDPTGRASNATVSPPFAGTSTGTCIIQELKRAAVPPFSGLPGTVTLPISLL